MLESQSPMSRTRPQRLNHRHEETNKDHPIGSSEVNTGSFYLKEGNQQHKTFPLSQYIDIKPTGQSLG